MATKKLYTKKEEEAMEIMDLNTPLSIVEHYPFRYEVIKETPYDSWNTGDKVTFEAKYIKRTSFARFGKLNRTAFEVVLENEEVIKCTIFNRPWFNQISYGDTMTLFGKYDGNNKVTVTSFNKKPLKEQEGIVPVYNLKEGVNLKTFRSLMKKTLEHYSFEDKIPEEYIRNYRLLHKDEALLQIHFPEDEKKFIDATRTLKYEEFLLFALVVQLRKSSIMLNDDHYAKKFNPDDVFYLANHLPFTLTTDQLKAVNEILADLKAPKAMYRLVQGDVGCGKTVVASLGLYANYLAHKQGAFMAPTEILANQQYADLKELFENKGIRIALLTSSLSLKERKEVLNGLADGSIDLAVGTHALIQEDVEFKDLGLVVTDEQHRFGVNQRKRLFEKGQYADFLVMSATPIPRTLANVLYGDMDLSTIETLPPGRKPVITKLIRENSLRSFLPEFMEMLKARDRAYIICPAIESDDESMRNVTKIYESLAAFMKGKYEVGFVHGRLSSEEKEEVMSRFKNGDIQILVSTTVVEVGVNVREANIMIIYNADRFGLSQLHQLRGRIKRGNKQGYCYLLTNSKEETALERLNVLVEHENGFEIAEYDLKLRGPGDILGVRQSGLPVFNLGNLQTDGRIIATALKDAREILSKASFEHVKLLEYCEEFIAENEGID